MKGIPSLNSIKENGKQNLLNGLNNKNVDSNPGLSSDVKPVNKIPGPKGLYSIPFIGIFLLLKPLSKRCCPNDELLLLDKFMATQS
jgi:hypothetical protein